VAIQALKALSSCGKHEYLFPSRATAVHRDPAKPHRWDIGKEFRSATGKHESTYERGEPHLAAEHDQIRPATMARAAFDLATWPRERRRSPPAGLLSGAAVASTIAKALNN